MEDPISDFEDFLIPALAAAEQVKMPWTYYQSTGNLASPDGTYVATGYSGNGEGKNNPAMQQVAFVGPIPVGLYTMLEPVESTDHGPYAIPLTPDPANEMFGRTDFMCHGDSVESPGCASEGCVIMPRPIRQQMWGSEEHRFQVLKEKSLA